MADYERTPFEYLSIEPYGLLDSIAAGFDGGLHPELRRLMHEFKAAAQQMRAANIIKFPGRFIVAGPAPKALNITSSQQAGNIVVLDFGKAAMSDRTKRVMPK